MADLFDYRLRVQAILCIAELRLGAGNFFALLDTGTLCTT